MWKTDPEQQQRVEGAAARRGGPEQGAPALPGGKAGSWGPLLVGCSDPPESGLAMQEAVVRMALPPALRPDPPRMPGGKGTVCVTWLQPPLSFTISIKCLIHLSVSASNAFHADVVMTFVLTNQII